MLDPNYSLTICCFMSPENKAVENCCFAGQKFEKAEFLSCKTSADMVK